MTLDQAINDFVETLFPHREMVRRRAVGNAINDDGTLNAAALRTTLRLSETWRIDGALAVGTDVANPVVFANGGSIKSLTAIVKVAPVGSEATFALEVDGTVVATVSIPAGSTSNTSPGLSIAVTAGQVGRINVTSAGSTTPAENAVVTASIQPA